MLLLLFLAWHGHALKRTEDLQLRRLARLDVTLQNLLGTIEKAPEQDVQQMQVRPEQAKLETGHSDKSWFATLVVESKASGIIILGHWLPGLPLVLPSFRDPRSKPSRQGQPVREHGGGGRQHPSMQLTQARRLETSPVGNRGSAEGRLHQLPSGT